MNVNHLPVHLIIYNFAPTLKRIFQYYCSNKSIIHYRIMMNKPTFIAGPCVIESQELLNTVAEELVRLNKKYDIDIIFKASFDKANRTSIHSFRGPGLDKGLMKLQTIKEKYGLRLLTDIHESYQAEAVGEIIDVIQIPAFLCRQTDLLVAAAKTGKIVNIKKAQFLSGRDMYKSVRKVELRMCG